MMKINFHIKRVWIISKSHKKEPLTAKFTSTKSTRKKLDDDKLDLKCTGVYKTNDFFSFLSDIFLLINLNNFYSHMN